MRVVRPGGEYLGEKLHRYRAELLMVSMGGVAASAIAGAIAHPNAGLLGLLITGVLASSAYAKLTRVRKGIRGEHLVTTLLQTLPDEYFLVNDVVLPRGRGNIDHVLIGPFGVMVIETKHYGGVISCRRDRWFVSGHPIRNISKQVTEGAISVKDLLGQRYPELRDSTLRWVEGVVVFTNPLGRLVIDRPGPTIVRYSELLTLIFEKSRRRRLTPALSGKLAESLAGVSREYVGVS